MSFNLLSNVFVTIISAAAVISLILQQRNKKTAYKTGFMGLDDIQLPAIVLQDLYKNSLVDLGVIASRKLIEKESGIAFLGNNQKQIAVIVNDSSTIYLPDDDLNFLIGILGACKLSMSDVALVNISKKEKLDYLLLAEELQAEKILLFGVEPSELELPLQFPFYQIQQFNSQVYLSSPALTIIAADKAEKTKLWNCLKQIFLG
jgi:hypothetical protein